MAGHGGQRHLKRQLLPLQSAVPRKGSRWVKKSSPGKHKASESLSLLALLRDRLSLVESARQAKKLLQDGMVLLDGLKVKSLDLPVGLMDVVSLPKTGVNYRIIIEKGVFMAKEINAEQAKLKYCRINGKAIIRKGKVQVNLHDSRNVLMEKEEDRFATGDTLVISIPKQAVKSFLKMENGANCLIFKGKHAGAVGILEEILPRAGSMPSNARLNVGGVPVVTLKDYLIVVDKDFKA
ncbi:TPA: 30S ribosomal protein S4e [Candidatus Micrarchaeota archaeon]|nr:30S ribosomal protein S4e [Candidatus Micrarchaeota archaeon]